MPEMHCTAQCPSTYLPPWMTFRMVKIAAPIVEWYHRRPQIRGDQVSLDKVWSRSGKGYLLKSNQTPYYFGHTVFLLTFKFHKLLKYCKSSAMAVPISAISLHSEFQPPEFASNTGHFYLRITLLLQHTFASKIHSFWEFQFYEMVWLRVCSVFNGKFMLIYVF